LAHTFGEWRTAFGEFQHTNLAYKIGEIKRQFFLLNAVRRQLFAWHTKVGEIDPGRSRGSPVVNFINILLENLLNECASPSFSLVTFWLCDFVKRILAKIQA